MSEIRYTVGVIGLGLIGGSMALDLKRRGFADTVLGVENDPVAAQAALTIGLVDQVVSYEDCVAKADIVVVAVPVGTAVKMVPDILDRFAAQAAGRAEPFSSASLRDPVRANAPEKGSALPARGEQIVIDVCSTKEQICNATKYHPLRRQFVSTHPMAGTEYSGPWAAQPGLFDGRACIFADAQESAPSALKTIGQLYAVLNMRPLYMNASQHDLHTAYVSHISHVTSFALALTVLEKEQDEKHIFDLASGGFSSTVRLAKSNADMWVPILAQNHDNVLQVMDTYIEKMQEFREAIAAYDENKIRELIAQANKIKKILR
ncbi:MAG: prephenate dehydrogenase/arogenate dehydrogenase family protein [Bacteroidales bacterium]|nr:prephenate dehydrogenase/arogenate dehydrogenase family protein [Bacteroidales bacterium]